MPPIPLRTSPLWLSCSFISAHRDWDKVLYRLSVTQWRFGIIASQPGWSLRTSVFLSLFFFLWLFFSLELSLLRSVFLLSELWCLLCLECFGMYSVGECLSRFRLCFDFFVLCDVISVVRVSPWVADDEVLCSTDFSAEIGDGYLANHSCMRISDINRSRESTLQHPMMP